MFLLMAFYIGPLSALKLPLLAVCFGQLFALAKCGRIFVFGTESVWLGIPAALRLF